MHICKKIYKKVYFLCDFIHTKRLFTPSNYQQWASNLPPISIETSLEADWNLIGTSSKKYDDFSISSTRNLQAFLCKLKKRNNRKISLQYRFGIPSEKTIGFLNNLPLISIIFSQKMLRNRTFSRFSCVCHNFLLISNICLGLPLFRPFIQSQFPRSYCHPMQPIPQVRSQNMHKKNG